MNSIDGPQGFDHRFFTVNCIAYTTFTRAEGRLCCCSAAFRISRTYGGTRSTRSGPPAAAATVSSCQSCVASVRSDAPADVQSYEVLKGCRRPCKFDPHPR